MPRRLLLPLLVLVLAVFAGCGSSSDTGSQGTATLILDFTPNAVHSGIFLAHARGFDEAEGVKLRVREPSSSTDSVKLLLSGRAQFAVLDIHDLAIARQRGRDVVGVMALVQRPLAAVLAQPGIRTPRNLAGKRAGVTGLPSDDAVLRSVVSGAGGDPSAVKKVTIGFDAVPALLGRRVAAATAFWNVEGVALRRKRPGIREFRVDQYGAPSYPELVLCATRQTIQDDPGLVRATVRSLQRGYDEVLTDPDRAADLLADRVPGLDRTLVHAEMDAVETSFAVSSGKVGSFNEPELRRWSRWEATFGIVRKPVDVAAAFDPAFTQ